MNNNYQQRVMNLFKFPVILKNETRQHFKNFFDNLYTKKDKKKVKLNKMKIDSEPIYINNFRNIYNMTPQKKTEFLHFVKNYLDNNYKNDEYQTPKLRKKKTNIQELFTMYNYYMNIYHENTYSTNYSKPNLMYKTSIKLNSSLKNNYRKNNLINDIHSGSISINKSYTPKPIQIESRKNIHFGTLRNKFNDDNNKIKMKKIKFRSQKINFTNKKINMEKFIQNNIHKYDYIKNNAIKLDDNNSLKRNNKKISINSSLNTILFKNEKITTKSIFEALLKNKCENMKNQILEKIGGEKKNNLGLKIKINNNIDVRNKDYIKNIFFQNTFNRINEDKINK